MKAGTKRKMKHNAEQMKDAAKLIIVILTDILSLVLAFTFTGKLVIGLVHGYVPTIIVLWGLALAFWIGKYWGRKKHEKFSSTREAIMKQIAFKEFRRKVVAAGIDFVGQGKITQREFNHFLRLMRYAAREFGWEPINEERQKEEE